MKLKNYQFAPGAIEYFPRRRRLSADAVLDALLLGTAVTLTALSAALGWMLGGML